MGFDDCACLMDGDDGPTAMKVRSRNSSLSTVIDGYCPSDCWLLYPFLICFAAYVCLGFMAYIPLQESELRYVIVLVLCWTHNVRV